MSENNDKTAEVMVPMTMTVICVCLITLAIGGTVKVLTLWF